MLACLGVSVDALVQKECDGKRRNESKNSDSEASQQTELRVASPLDLQGMQAQIY